MNSNITVSGVNSIVVNGTPIQELIEGGKFFEEIISINDLVGGGSARPIQERIAVAEAIALGFCDHGITPPSTTNARISASCGCSVSNAYISAFATVGVKHAPIESCCKFLLDAERNGIEVAMANVGKIKPGFGHPVHLNDPRVAPLLAKSRRGTFVEIAQSVEVKIGHKMNYAGAVAAVALDNGLLPEYAFMLMMVGRLIGITGHIVEQRKAGKMILNEE